MTMAYLSISSYGAALAQGGRAGRGSGRIFVAFGSIAAAGFLAFRLFDLPLIPRLDPFAMGIILLRRNVRSRELAPAAP